MAKEVKKPVKKPVNNGGRVRKLSKKQVKTKAKKQIKTRKAVPGSFRLSIQVVKAITRHWKKLGGIVLVYLILNILFASGISDVSSKFSTIKIELQTGHDLARATAGFATLVGTSGASGSSTGSSLQAVLIIIESLVIIWALRHLLSGQTISVKQAYYQAMAPLIPFILVIAFIIIQLLPVTIGAAVLAAVITSVITNMTIATIASVIIFVILAAWSIYMVCASIFALYIVTLPDMQPRQALRAAKDLVRFRRLLIIRKVLFLPLVLFVCTGLFIVPMILYASFLVPVVFYVISMLVILFAHTYLYSLYRSLIE
jgi:hypothetical protein